jgi:ribose transport system substrate-binding protein
MRQHLTAIAAGPHRSRRYLAVAGVVGSLTLAAACGSSSSGSSAGGGSSPSASSGSSGLAAVQAAVASESAKLSSYPVPTQSVSGVSSLTGKTVYYIPITQQAPQFAVTGTALKKALSAIGAKLVICNGNSNPSTIGGCVTQAIGANAGAIIADSIPYVLAANGFASAQAKGIPVLITDQIADPSHPASKTLGYLEGAGSEQLKDVADWIIADSGGKAKVVVDEATDSPSTIAYVGTAQKEFSSKCPQCTVTINKISSANFNLIASSTSSAVLKTAGVNYVLSEFNEFLQPIIGGVQQSGKIAQVKGASTAADTSGLSMLAKKNFLYVDAGQASAYQGWADADAAIRLMLKQTLPTYTIPARLFTRDNVSSVTDTEAAQQSGSWFGPTTFASQFRSLWGVS